MRTHSIAALVALTLTAGLSYAQGLPDADARLRDARRAAQQAAAQLRERTTCSLPDGSSHKLGAVATYEGQTYRCVEALRSNGVALTAYTAVWVRDSK